MRAHLLQYDIAWEDPAANHATVRRLVESARVAAGDLILLPEMFDTGFSLNVDTTADEAGESAAFLSSLAAQTRAYVQAGLTARGPDNRGRNRALIFNPDGREIARYDKIHPFSFGREPERFSGGDRVALWRWRGPTENDSISVCPVICYDLRFPELFRAGLALGAQAFAIGANWPAARVEHWRALAIARAIENQAWVLALNRCGSDPHLAYPGASLVVDPQGRVLAEAGGAEAVLTVDLPAAALAEWRETFSAWRDPRPGLLPQIGPDGRFSSGKADSGR
ncbi:MAG: nitrilase-related carbon-nitrogen hydrolase [Planctomycetota bacterium]|nr:nitrilase-related carbon-nitrogen hydrolase [Planctomycetota bacterium]